MDTVSEKFTIQLRIGNHTYPITVHRETEEMYREATKRINDKLNLYKQRFPNLGDENYLSMVTLDIAVQLIQNEKRNDTEPYNDVLALLTTEIEAVLKR